MNKALLIIMAVYLVGFCVCVVISVPLIMWAVRKNDEEEGYYEPMETPGAVREGFVNGMDN